MNCPHRRTVTAAKQVRRGLGRLTILCIASIALACDGSPEPTSPRADLELISPNNAASAKRKTVNHPGDGFASINDAIAGAGCGGTVQLDSGVYNERVFAECGVRIVGDGVGRTIIHDEGLEAFQGGLVNFGGVPFAPAEVTSGYELSDLTLESGPESPSLVGAGAGWTRDLHIHDVEIVGFTVGVGIAVSTASKIENARVTGQGREPTNPLTKCIQFVEFGLFLDQLPHMSGHVIQRNALQDCGIGLDLQNSTGAIVAFNRIEGSVFGMSVFGASRLNMHHNVISRADISVGPFIAAGFDPSNMHDSNIHNNHFCDNTIGVHFSFNQEPDAFGFGPSSGNDIHNNFFAGPGDQVVFSAPNMGPRNRVFASRDIPIAACP